METTKPTAGLRYRCTMDALITRIEEEDPELNTLVLTSECDTREQLDRLLEGLEVSSIVDSVIFRESFFPLRRIREHLERDDFLRMIHGVSWHVTDTLRLPPTMMGMVPGRLASLMIGPFVRHYHAHEAITFALDSDVLAISDRLDDCTQLETLDLGDSYFSRMRPPCLDPILMTIGTKDTLTVLDISTHPEQQIKRPVLSTTAALESLSNTRIHTLNLSRLGLLDEHFGAISNLIATLPTLQWLCLDGNHPSVCGLDMLADTLVTSTNLIGLSLLEIGYTDRIKWNRLFPSNWYLQRLELDGTFSAAWWLDMNQHGRAHWMQEEIPLNLWPLVLESVSESSCMIWYIVQTFPFLLNGNSSHLTIDN